METWHASLGYAHRFGEDLGLRLTGIYSAETYDVYQVDFLTPEIAGSQNQSSERWELELDLHWRPSERIDALLGYRLLHIDGVRDHTVIPPLFDLEEVLDPYTTQALFTQVTWRLDPSIQLVGGLRVSLLPQEYRRSQQLRRDQAPVRGVVPVENSTPINGQLALLWTPTDDQVLKLSGGTASQDVDVFTIADPERIRTIEASYTLTRPRWMASLGLFQNDLSQLARTIQRLDGTSGIYTTLSDNVGEWRTRGLELILEARPVRGLSLSTSLTW